MSIYTRKGDKGTTTLLNDSVAKDDVRIEVNGEIDELSAVLGLARASLGDEALCVRIEQLQRLLVSVMAIVAGVTTDSDNEFVTAVSQLEHEIDEFEDKNPHFNFVVPSKNMPNAFLHYARTKARTAERRMWFMNKMYPLPEVVMQFMNRLSDCLFCVAEK